MPELPSSEIVLVVLVVFLVAGIVKGVVGLGFPTVSLGLLTATFGHKEALVLILVPTLLTNVWQGLTGGNLRALWPRMWPLLFMLCIFSWFGAGILATADSRILTAIFGLLLAVYAVIALTTPAIGAPGRHERWLSPLIGGVTGFLGGMTGAFSVPAVPYLQALGLSRDQLIQSMGILFMVATLALGTGLAGNSLLKVDLGLTSAIGLVPAFAGMTVGRHVRRRIPEEKFRRVFLYALLLLGVYIGASALF